MNGKTTGLNGGKIKGKTCYYYDAFLFLCFLASISFGLASSGFADSIGYGSVYLGCYDR